MQLWASYIQTKLLMLFIYTKRDGEQRAHKVKDVRKLIKSCLWSTDGMLLHLNNYMTVYN